MNKLKKELKKGFTLIELMVVIAIIGILATTLAPKLREQLAKAKDAKAIALLGTVRTATSVLLIDNSVSDNPGAIDLTWKGLESEMDVSAAGLLDESTGMINVGGSRTITTAAGKPPVKGDLKYNGKVTIKNDHDVASLTGTKALAIQDASELHLKEETGTDSYSTEGKEWASY